MVGSQVSFKVTTEKLHEQASKVLEGSKKINNSFSDMETIIRGMQSYWEGEASNVNMKKYREFKDETLEMLARMEEQVTDLEKIAGVYERTEKKVVSKIEELPLDVIE